jgi:hypothetical protein
MPRGTEKYITIHYSGVDYNDVTQEQEKARIIAEAKYQLNKNWGTAKEPLYGDGLMYDYVVLKSGEVVRTRRERLCLWHCGNVVGNALSWSVHVMLGPKQDMTELQKKGLYDLVDDLRSNSGIPRNNVVGHCEWPRIRGEPILSDDYVLLPGQSVCPGPKVMRAIHAYRALSDEVTPELKHFQVIGNVDVARVYTARSYFSPRAVIEDNFVDLVAGTVIEVDDVTDGWAHLTSQIGFVSLDYLKNPGDPDPVQPPVPVVVTEARQYSELSSVIVERQPEANRSAIVAYLAALPNQGYTAKDIEEIIIHYQTYGEMVQVDWLAAFAQNLHETDNLRSWWSQRPRRNPAGLRVTGERRAQQPPNDAHWAFNPDTNMWHKGMSFDSWDSSAKAHIAYLLSYALTNQQLTPTQRTFIAESPVSFILDRNVNRGVAPTLSGLNGRWAVPGHTYATKIAVVANRLVRK